MARSPEALIDASGRWLWFKAASDPFRLVLAAIILIDISRIHQQFGFLAPLRPALLSFLAGVGLAVLKPKYLDLKNLTRTPYPKAVVALLIIALCSLAFGISMGASGAFFLDVYSKVLVTAFLILAGIRSPEHLKLIVWTYVISCGLWVIMAFTVFDLQPASGAHMRLENLYSYDANDLGLILLVGLPLALWVLASSRGIVRGLIAAIIVGIGATIALTGSRGAMVGLVFTGIALLYLSRHVPVVTRAGIVLVMLMGLIVAAPPGYWGQMRTILEPGDDYNLTEEEGRKAIALRGLSYMAAYPMFGVGMNNFGRAEAYIGRAHQQRDGIGVRWIAPHNTYVQVGAEMGVFALGIWMWILGAGVFGLTRLRNRLPRSWLKGTPRQKFLYTGATFLPASFVAFASSSIFLSFAYLTPIYLLVGLMSALHILVKRELQESPPPELRTRVAAVAGARSGAFREPLVDRAPAGQAMNGGSTGGTILR